MYAFHRPSNFKSTEWINNFGRVKENDVDLYVVWLRRRESARVMEGAVTSWLQ